MKTDYEYPNLQIITDNEIGFKVIENFDIFDFFRDDIYFFLKIQI